MRIQSGVPDRRVTATSSAQSEPVALLSRITSGTTRPSPPFPELLKVVGGIASHAGDRIKVPKNGNQ